jgi:hypothetical protein
MASPDEILDEFFHLHPEAKAANDARVEARVAAAEARVRELEEDTATPKGGLNHRFRTPIKMEMKIPGRFSDSCN